MRAAGATSDHPRGELAGVDGLVAGDDDQVVGVLGLVHADEAEVGRQPGMVTTCRSPGHAGRERRCAEPPGSEHKGTYGVRRVHAELRGFGHTVNCKRVERLMRVNRLEAATCGAASGPRSPTGSHRPPRTLSNATSPPHSWT
ncbi:hypothetical protein GCM10010341_76420 [Streptomyces noursei]|nr:hypothetical protein GCM10010341_76420 [Streptomyces noursei]